MQVALYLYLVTLMPAASAVAGPPADRAQVQPLARAREEPAHDDRDHDRNIDKAAEAVQKRQTAEGRYRGAEGIGRGGRRNLADTAGHFVHRAAVEGRLRAAGAEDRQREACDVLGLRAA